MSIGRRIYNEARWQFWIASVYLTCAQAFAEIGEDADLSPRKAIVVGTKAYLLDRMSERSVQPKPKRAKGVRA